MTTDNTQDFRIPLRSAVLQEAETLISTDRAEQYGDAHENFSRIASLWRAQFGWTVKPEDVAVAMILLKVARLSSSTQRRQDTWVDIAGYSALGCELSFEEVIL